MAEPHPLIGSHRQVKDWLLVNGERMWVWSMWAESDGNMYVKAGPDPFNGGRVKVEDLDWLPESTNKPKDG